MGSTGIADGQLFNQYHGRAGGADVSGNKVKKIFASIKLGSSPESVGAFTSGPTALGHIFRRYTPRTAAFGLPLGTERAQSGLRRMLWSSRTSLGISVSPLATIGHSLDRRS